MNILSFHLGHDGSVSVIEGDEIVIHHQLDRFSKIKNLFYPTIELFDKIKKLKINFDKVVVTNMSLGDQIPISYFIQKYLNITNRIVNHH